MRIAILWIELTGYLNSCLRELASRPGVELFVAHRTPGDEAPFRSDQFGWLSQRFVWQSHSAMDSLEVQLRAFNPDVIVFAGWGLPAYRKIARRWKSRAIRIMTMDNCWVASPAQLVASFMTDVLVRNLADAIWVPGERQAKFARKLHFKQREILYGLYSCDYQVFAAVHENRVRMQEPLGRAFVFIGRMIEEKGVPTLTQAYKLYRSRTCAPWQLICYGKGPLAGMLAAEPGITVVDFVQPNELPEKLTNVGCLVLPSSFEPWAVVVHEAAAAGLPVLASSAVGSTPHLVQDSYNGFLFGVNDFEGLSRLMERISLMDDAKLNSMAAASSSLAQQFTPRRWADTLLDFVAHASHNGSSVRLNSAFVASNAAKIVMSALR